MFPASLLTTLLLALAVSGNPVVVRNSPVTLPLSRRVNTTSVHNLLRHDLSRAKALRARAEAKIAGQFHVDAVINEQVDNQAVTYIASVGVGSPATQYQLLIDTGSSNTWVGATRSYVRTGTSVQTSNRVSVTYGSGSFSGTEFTDTVTLASGLVISGQSIGVASTSTGFEGTDGILGIGPVDLTLGTLSPATNSLVPTVTDNLFSHGTISANEIGISFSPTTSLDSLNGELTWGGTDSSKLTGSIGFTPVTNIAPASEFWGITQTIRYGASTTILSTNAGIVDTGTTLLLLASDAFARYRSATGAVPDNTTGLLRITAAQFANLQSLFFTIGGVSYEFTANAQLWPRALNTAIGGTSGNIYLIVGNLGTPSGEGFDFINGFAFLERFYSVFDTAGHRVGFANTASTHSTIN
ncbi:aspartic peptidase A1 [Collybia nuda]|uniref:Aspartic peptidase A1 n=1 Tax=Collybia nuda TaxID=64659 RepID=A0A9P5YJM7_9AGAR|nr:aspartic peptidase A1 [Collybia nuda]